jgi:hypothetical protein
MGSYEYLLKDKPDDLKVKDDGTMEFSNSFMDDVKNHKPGERNERLLKISRAAGTGVLLAGLGRLYSGKKLTLPYYGAMGATLATNCLFGGKEETEAIIHELTEGAIMFAGIMGLTVFGEGMNVDAPDIYKAISKEAKTREEKIAAIMTFASVYSPMITTVATSSIESDDAKELYMTRKERVNKALDVVEEVDKEFLEEVVDPTMATTMREHISNNSGLLGFGDMPAVPFFMKYKFMSGLAWQIKASAGPVIGSPFWCAFKTNYLLNKRDGMSKSEAMSKAIKDSTKVINGAGVMLTSTMFTALNAQKVLFRTALALGKKPAEKLGLDYDRILKSDLLQQSPEGIVFNIYGRIQEEFGNMAKLIRDKDPQFVNTFTSIHGHNEDKEIVELLNTHSEEIAKEFETLSGQMSDYSKGKISPAMKGILETFKKNEKRTAEQQEKINESLTNVLQAISEDTYKEANNKLIAANESVKDVVKDNSFSAYTGMLSDFMSTLKGEQSPARVFKRITDIDAIEYALGPSQTDIINVIPFQAASIPHIIHTVEGAFKSSSKAISKSLDGVVTSPRLKESIEDAAKGGIAGGLSCLLDNAVVTKLTLDLEPDKPQIGWLCPIMAGTIVGTANPGPNFSYMPTNLLSLLDDLKSSWRHLDNLALGSFWTGLITYIGVKPPELRNPNKKKENGHHASLSDHSNDNKQQLAKAQQSNAYNRRDFFSALSGQKNKGFKHS